MLKSRVVFFDEKDAPKYVNSWFLFVGEKMKFDDEEKINVGSESRFRV